MKRLDPEYFPDDDLDCPSQELLDCLGVPKGETPSAEELRAMLQQAHDEFNAPLIKAVKALRTATERANYVNSHYAGRLNDYFVFNIQRPDSIFDTTLKRLIDEDIKAGRLFIKWIGKGKNAVSRLEIGSFEIIRTKERERKRIQRRDSRIKRIPDIVNDEWFFDQICYFAFYQYSDFIRESVAEKLARDKTSAEKEGEGGFSTRF